MSEMFKSMLMVGIVADKAATLMEIAAFCRQRRTRISRLGLILVSLFYFFAVDSPASFSITSLKIFILWRECSRRHFLDTSNGSRRPDRRFYRRVGIDASFSITSLKIFILSCECLLIKPSICSAVNFVNFASI